MEATKKDLPPGSSADMLLDIRIPEGLQSGETFQCEAEGIIFDLFVPEGYSGGQMLHLELLQDAGKSRKRSCSGGS